MILLDTNAAIWLDQGHRRSAPLARSGATLYVSPVMLLELQVLQEAGRVRLPKGDPQALVAGHGWIVDEPPAGAWFRAALEFGWTRDMFDRLVAAHARLRGWRLATADAVLLAALGPRHTLEL